jgi:hypothetical protein
VKTAIPRVTTKLAMRIAGLDPLRFNEAVAGGIYQCAPRTVPGKARTFTETDLHGLYYFARLMEGGFENARAGEIACGLVAFLLEHQTDDKPFSRVVYVVSRVRRFFVSAHEFEKMEKTGKEFNATGGGAVYSIKFELDFVRERIREAIEEERSIIGERDDD